MTATVIGDLIRAVLENVEDAPAGSEGWVALAVVLEFPEGVFNEAHGYLYGAEGSIWPIAADPWAVKAAVAAYTESHYRPGEPLPRKILLQFDRTTGRYEVTFEETDEDRWAVTPRTFRTVREELRPKFA